jgi:hypothetical protein
MLSILDYLPIKSAGRTRSKWQIAVVHHSKRLIPYIVFAIVLFFACLGSFVRIYIPIAFQGYFVSISLNVTVAFGCIDVEGEMCHEPDIESYYAGVRHSSEFRYRFSNDGNVPEWNAQGSQLSGFHWLGFKARASNSRVATSFGLQFPVYVVLGGLCVAGLLMRLRSRYCRAHLVKGRRSQLAGSELGRIE